ncbi:MAG: DivIVA domain-containing protein [Nitrospina sp.]|nr:DivIVA domain-containing protein [Nitrospina sp.]
MKLNYLDILEQCFRNKIFGYNKDDVDTFLHLVADDFKELYEELELLKIEIAKKDKDMERINEEASHKREETKTEASKITPDIIKEKAKRIINAAREIADQHKKKAVHELSSLKKEIKKLKEEQKSLIETQK